MKKHINNNKKNWMDLIDMKWNDEVEVSWAAETNAMMMLWIGSLIMYPMLVFTPNASVPNHTH